MPEWINDKDREEKKIIIDRSTIPDLLTDASFIDAVNIWIDYKAFGNPYESGYMTWPCQYYDVVKLFDGLYARYKMND